MTKVNLTTLGTVRTDEAVTALNTNITAIGNAIENTLSRDGTAPNEMDARLDMNDHQIYNLGAPTLPDQAVRLQDLEDAVLGISAIVGISGANQSEAQAGAINNKYMTPLRTKQGLDFQRPVISPSQYGSVGDGVTNDTDAILASIDAMTTAGDFASWELPTGVYRIDEPLVFDTLHRSKFNFRGAIAPDASFSGDNLVTFVNSSNDTIMASMAMQTEIRGLTLDCEFGVHGVQFDGMYDFLIDGLNIWRPYGWAIDMPRVQEGTMIRPLIAAAKYREDTSITGAATAYDNAHAYSPGDIIKLNYTTYDAGTTYAAGDRIRYSGFIYRSWKAGNIGHTPDSNGDYWERMPEYYFLATALHDGVLTGKNPKDTGTDYTTRTGTSGNQYWKPLYPYDPAWRFLTRTSADSIDNVKVFNFISRSNATESVVLLDEIYDGVAVSKCEFYAPQMHAITSQYITSFNTNSLFAASHTLYGGDVIAPTRHILWHVPNVVGLKVIGGQTRPGTVDYAHGWLLGTEGCSGNVARSMIGHHYTDGNTSQGSYQFGRSNETSVALTGGQWYETDHEILLTGTQSHNVIDLTGETQLELKGTATVLAGGSSIVVTFATPMIDVPVVSLYPVTDASTAALNLHGLSWGIKDGTLTKAGFTIEVFGKYCGALQSSTYNHSGAASQTFTYNHAFGTIHSGIDISVPTTDPNAGYYVYEGASDTGNSIIKIVGATVTADFVLKWHPYWTNKTPVAIDFKYYARMQNQVPPNV